MTTSVTVRRLESRFIARERQRLDTASQDVDEFESGRGQGCRQRRGRVRSGPRSRRGSRPRGGVDATHSLTSSPPCPVRASSSTSTHATRPRRRHTLPSVRIRYAFRTSDRYPAARGASLPTPHRRAVTRLSTPCSPRSDRRANPRRPRCRLAPRRPARRAQPAMHRIVISTSLWVRELSAPPRFESS